MGHFREVAGRRWQVAGAVLLALSLAGCGSSGGTPGEAGTSEVGTTPLAVASPSFRNGGVIPRQFTCDGAGTRPTLSWGGGPPQAAEGAVLGGGPGAPGGTFGHWAGWGRAPPARGGGSGGAAPPGAPGGGARGRPAGG